MNKTKFKVGKKYRVTDGYAENGNVIKITEIVGDCAFYETVAGTGKGYSSSFGIPSGFSRGLIPFYADDIKIIITTDGKTTTAKMYNGKKLVKSAKTDCHPDDEFIFIIGASIALERLTGQLESNLEVEFYTGKVVCVANTFRYLSFTVGKVYQIENGEFKTDSGGYIVGVTSVKDFNDNFKLDGVKFLEIVE